MKKGFALMSIVFGLFTGSSGIPIDDPNPPPDIRYVRGPALLALLFVHDYSNLQDALDFLAQDLRNSQG
jgi:hypothetical protein